MLYLNINLIKCSVRIVEDLRPCPGARLSLPIRPVPGSIAVNLGGYIYLHKILFYNRLVTFAMRSSGAKTIYYEAMTTEYCWLQKICNYLYDI